MSESMLKQEIKVYSEKYDIHGTIKDYGVVTKLYFSYDGRTIEMGIQRNALTGENYADIGREMIESYVSKLVTREERKLQLHYWYVCEKEVEGKKYLFGNGIVTGHKRLEDSTFIHTSAVKDIQVNEDTGDLVIATTNSIYHCPLAYCSFPEQDKYPEILPGYNVLKEKYENAREYPSIEQGNVLLVLANFCEYYFHSLYYIPADSENGAKEKYYGHPHVGMFQDSYLVNTSDYKIDLRYYPHYQNIEFYSEQTNDCPLFVENIGDTVLYAKTHIGTVKLEPGERKKITAENAEQDPPALPRGDLYPAGIIE